jgi:type II secretory pathway pseudopilin PulG
MLVVAIIGFLAAIALPKFANLVIKAREAQDRGSLGGIRSAISIYYADNAFMPENFAWLEDFLVPKYMDRIPAADLKHIDSHGRSSGSYSTATVPQDNKWTGNNTPWAEEVNGGVLVEVRISCTHTDSKNVVWTVY